LTSLRQIELIEQLVQVLPRELPFKRLGRRFPVVLKIQEPLCQSVQVRKIVRRQDLPLNDGEVDLRLVQPTGLHDQIRGEKSGDDPDESVPLNRRGVR